MNRNRKTACLTQSGPHSLEARGIATSPNEMKCRRVSDLCAASRLCGVHHCSATTNKSRGWTPQRRDGTQRKTERLRLAGFTLVEMLIVVTIVGILASVVIPTLSSTSGAVSLEAMARTLAADIRIARQSAVQYNSDFALTLNLTNNSYTVAKASGGTAPGLVNALAPSGSGNTIDLDTYGAGRIKQTHVVIGGAALKKSKTSVIDLTFKPSGGTGPNRTEDTVFWLAENTGANRRSILITVSWITGAVTVGDVQSFPVPLAMPNF